MNAILATVMITTVSVVIPAVAMAQSPSAPTLGEMKSAAEQQANQEKQATKETVQAEKATAQQAVTDEKKKARIWSSARNPRPMRSQLSNNSERKPGCPEQGGRKDGGGTEAEGYGQRKAKSVRPCRRHRINPMPPWEKSIVRWTACSANNGTERTPHHATSGSKLIKVEDGDRFPSREIVNQLICVPRIALFDAPKYRFFEFSIWQCSPDRA